MTKLAIYDKKYGETDKRVNDLYYRDYVYRKNFYVRLSAALGCVVLFGFYIANMLLSGEVDFFEMDYTNLVIDMGIFVGVVMLAFTLIGSHIATKEFKEIKNRLVGYFSLIKQLEELKNPTIKEDNDDDSDTYQDSHREGLRSRNGSDAETTRSDN